LYQKGGVRSATPKSPSAEDKEERTGEQREGIGTVVCVHTYLQSKDNERKGGRNGPAGKMRESFGGLASGQRKKTKFFWPWMLVQLVWQPSTPKKRREKKKGKRTRNWDG